MTNNIIIQFALFIVFSLTTGAQPVKVLLGQTLTEKSKLTVAFNPTCDIIPHKGKYLTFRATAYSLIGKTFSGERTRHGVIAVDRKVLRIGTRVRIISPKSVAGIYTALDTGKMIRGHRLDIFMYSRSSARNFGVKTVRLEKL
jgi:3D (Asp-Asp-Asp) domain-containing protein